MDKKLVIWLLILIFASIVSFLFNPTLIKKTDNEKLQITASFYPLYFFSSQIGGDKAEVWNITPAGSEPHDYEPTIQDIVRIENSDMLVLNGIVEAWGDRIKDNLKGKNVKILTVGDGLFTTELSEENHHHHEAENHHDHEMQDPHVWLNPILMKKQVERITDGYISIDPKNSDYYNENKKQADIMLDQLDADYRQGLASCQSKDIITSHTAFAYLAEEYGLNQVSISGISPEEEPSAQQLAEVANFAKQNNVKYIFFESLVSPKLSETIAGEVGAKTLVLDPLEGISDNDTKLGKNYFTIMKDNLKNLQIALQCSK